MCRVGELHVEFRFYLETYGCSLNSADSDLIVGQVRKLGGARVIRLADADILIVNTCGVKEPTEDRIIYRLEQLSQESAPLLVAGCLPKISMERVKAASPGFAAILGPQSIGSIQSVITRVLQGERGIVNLKADSGSKLSYFEGPTSGIVCTVPICEGCLGHCTYCAVRLARGSIRSHRISGLYDVVERCVHQGYREIRLTAQDTSAFGSDTGESIVELLRALDRIEGPHVFRLGMFNPSLAPSRLHDLLDIMKSTHFFKFFHVPLQSGSDQILSAMGRDYSVADWMLAIDNIREAFTHSTVATDVIVGFPRESEDDFQATVDALERAAPEIVNISKYGDRPKTPASDSPEKVSTSIKKARSRKMSTVVAKVTLAANASWVGWSGAVIATETGSRGGAVCRNSAYRPIVIRQPVRLGESIEVRIVSAKRTYLAAEPLA
jgi:MiaB-like tRNA modifying enzyme